MSTTTSQPVPLASLVCPNLKCRKFLTCPQDQRGQVIACKHCKVRIRVPENKQGTAQLAGGSDWDHEGGVRGKRS